MVKNAFITLFFFVSMIFVFPVLLIAQDQDVDDLLIGVDTASQLLADIPIAHFEDADSWATTMSIDEGIVLSMKRRGKPLDVPDVDPNDGTKNEYALGVKVMFNKRGYANFTIRPPRPIKIPGITKALSMWVDGRNYRHTLYVHLIDYFGNEMILTMGELNHVGWKKLTVTIPTTLRQDNFHAPEWQGLSFVGMSIKTDPGESFGIYYVYFDELRAITDIYNETHRDEDAMQDGW